MLDFIEEVAKNYEIIKEGKDRDGNQTYLLQLTDKHNNTLVVELSGDGSYWNINTAGIFKTSYGKNRKEVYNRHTTAKQPAETVEASQDAEQGGTQISSSMNAPTLSDGKDTQNSETEIEKQEKISETAHWSPSIINHLKRMKLYYDNKKRNFVYSDGKNKYIIHPNYKLKIRRNTKTKVNFLTASRTDGIEFNQDNYIEIG